MTDDPSETHDPRDASALADAATQDRQTLSETIRGPDGEAYRLEVREPTIGEIERLERREQDGDLSEIDVVRELWDRYLVAPDLDPDDVGVSWVETITTGMYRAFGGGDEIEAALDELAVEGNGT